MLREARAIVRRFRHERRGGSIDGLLSRARPTDPFEERLRWLAAVFAWLSRTVRVEPELAPPAHTPEPPPPADTPPAHAPQPAPPERALQATPPAHPPHAAAHPHPLLAAAPSRAPQATRLRHLLNVLDRNPEWKGAVARTLRATLRETDALELFCETGLPREPAFWSETLERLMQRLLPADPGRRDLGRLIVSVFPDEESVAWLEQIDEETLARVAGLVSFGMEPGEPAGFAPRRDMPDALVSLCSEIASVGLSSAIRRRIGAASFRDLAFYGLAAAAEEVARAAREGNEAALADATAGLGRRLAGCRHAMAAVHAHLDQYGVSTRIVYQLERMEAEVRRAELLLGRINDAGGAPANAAAFARLVRDAVESTRVGGLVERNVRLLARKVVDRSAETGAHYIARNRDEYLAMVRSAAGGGLVTAVTAWVKLGITFLKAPPFVEGVLASLNYAASFVAIQLAHFTLATKQPAMTGPALARRLERAGEPGGVAAFVDEAFHLLRSQAASIVGNLATVVPGVAAVDLLARAALGHPLLPIDKAEATLASLSLLGPTPFYAALTGLLLYLSSLAAGWADNWFVLRELQGGLAASPGLVRSLGRGRAARLAQWLRENVSGFAGNVSLGVLLGMTPAFGRFLGLPLDVRHVTLSAGFLAASASALGPRALLTGPFWWAVAGVGSMAVLNVGVSFALALGTAVRARGLRAPERSALRAAFWTRVWRQPADLVTPD